MHRYWTAAAAVLLAVSSASVADEAPSPGSETITTSIVVEPDGSYVETAHTERFANNDAGALGAGRVSIPFNARLQDVTIVEAYTLKPDGVRIPLDPASIQEQLQRDAGSFSSFSDQRTKILEFPQFLNGDTIVYTVRMAGHPYYPGYYTHREVFTPSSVTRSRTTTISVPKKMVLKTDLRDVEMTTRDEDGRRIYTLKHVSKKPETSPGATALARALTTGAIDEALNKIPHYAVSSFADYAELGRAQAALVEPKVVTSTKVKELAARILGGETVRREQARKLYEWVVKNIRYVAIELGRGSLEPHEADAIIDNGYGDCKDHDLLLRALYKAAGIDSQSVLINGTYFYSLTPAPGVFELNHEITYLPEFDLYLDSSNSLAPFGVVSTNLYGKPAIRISAKGATLVTLPPAPLSEVRTDVRETLASDGTLTGSVKTVVSGPASLTSRGTSLRLQTSSSDSAVSTRLSGRNLKAPKGTTQNDPPLELGANHNFSTSFTSTGWSEWLAGTVASPLPGASAALSGEAAAGIASISNKGDDPVACGATRAVEHIELTLPDSYNKTPHLPDDTKIDSTHLTFTAHWSYTGHVLTLERTLTTKFPEARCSGKVKTDTAEALTRVRATFTAQIALDPTVVPKGDTAGDAAALKSAQEAFGKGDFATTVKLLTGVLGHSLSEQQAYNARVNRGLASFRLGQLNAAIEDLSAAIRMRPDGQIQTYEMRARCYMRTGRPKDALADLDIAIERAPEDLMLRTFHADVASAAGAFASAAKDYDVILKNNPKDHRTLLMRANAHFGAGEYDQAASDYEAAGNLSGSDRSILTGLCDALARSSRLGEAQYQCSRALEVNPQSGPELEARGLVFFRQGKYAKALEDFSKATETFPQTARYRYERGLTKVKLGDSESGERDIARALKLDPEVVQKLPKQMRP